MFLVVTPASGRAEALVPAVRAAISRVDREQLVSVRSIMTLEDIAWTVTGRHRFRAVLVIAFAALALVLAMVGLFGILAYSVQQHVRDFGVRRALGATTGDVLRVVIVNAVSVIAAGAAIGNAVSAASARLIRNVLFGVQPLDMTTFILVTLVLAAAAACRSSVPPGEWRESIRRPRWNS